MRKRLFTLGYYQHTNIKLSRIIASASVGNEMEELLTLRELLVKGNIPDALLLVDEMTEMSKDDKINKIISYAKILLLHLIKCAAEQRTTRSWELSIANAVNEIQKTNRRRKAGGTYLSQSELQQAIIEAYPIALKFAAAEAFEGKYEAAELATKVQQDSIVQEAIALINAPSV